MPTTNVRDTLGDFVNQYTGFAQTTTTLGLANGVPQQTLADPFPANNPVIEPYGQDYGRYTESRRRRQPRPVPAAAADQRSLQRVLSEGSRGARTVVEAELLLQSRHARALRHQPEHGGPRVQL